MPALEIEYALNILMMLLEPLSHSESLQGRSGSPFGLPDQLAGASQWCAPSRREDRNPIAVPARGVEEMIEALRTVGESEAVDPVELTWK